MPYDVLLRNNASGEVRRHREAGDWEDFSDFMWTEGNFACDCNRSLLFARAGNEPDPPDRKCSSELFSAIRAELPDGTHIPLDAED